MAAAIHSSSLSLMQKWGLLLHDILHYKRSYLKGYALQRTLLFSFYSRFYHLEQILLCNKGFVSQAREKLHHLLTKLRHELIIHDGKFISNQLKLNTYKAFIAVCKNDSI